jgi:hypothetical protein
MDGQLVFVLVFVIAILVILAAPKIIDLLGGSWRKVIKWQTDLRFEKMISKHNLEDAEVFLAKRSESRKKLAFKEEYFKDLLEQTRFEGSEETSDLEGLIGSKDSSQETGVPCADCGVNMVKEGQVYKCTNCGSSSSMS